MRLPIYLDRLGWLPSASAAPAIAAYTLAVALLMVSRFPTWSGKRTGQRIPRDSILPVLVVAVLLVALLFSYPFPFLACGSLLYLLHLPFAWRAWKRAQTRSTPKPDTHADP